jgi:hypothetical protein
MNNKKDNNADVYNDVSILKSGQYKLFCRQFGFACGFHLYKFALSFFMLTNRHLDTIVANDNSS